MNVINKAGWTAHEPTVCECIGTRIATITIPAGKKPVLIMDLVIPETGVILTKFFNVEITPKGNYSVKHNSDFAKLYRLTKGKNPKARYSRADQLLRQMEGYSFVVTYEDASTSQIDHYFKVTTIAPTDPIITEEWFATGVLKVKKRSRKQSQLNANKLAKSKQQIGNGLAKVKQKVGNGLAMKKAENPHLNLVSTGISIPYTSLKHNIEPLPHMMPIPVSDAEDKTTMTIDDKGGKHYQYHQRQNETKDEYHDRVIDESLGP